MAEFPRVLFVTSHAFNHLTGGGITFSNLFSGWPKDCLATVHNDSVPTSEDVCDRYYLLTRDEIDLFGPLRLARLFKGGNTNVAGGAGVPQMAGGAGVIARVQGDSAPQSARLTPALERWIAAFRPELIYTILGSNAIMTLVAKIRDRFRIPEVVHMMDDWPSCVYQHGLFSRFERARMKRLVADHVSSAGVTMGIGAAMCAAFSERYGRSFVAFQNCVDVTRWRPKARTDSAVAGGVFRIVYFGSVIANAQLESLIDVCQSVVRLNVEGFRLEFDIVSPSFYVAAHRDRLILSSDIRLIEPTQDDAAFFTTLAAADALVLPVNFDHDSISFIRYSMPTKVPAYMASGTPILVYGPRGVAQVDYAADEEWGHVVVEREAATLDAGLKKILTDSELRECLRLRGQSLALARHDSGQVRSAFQSALRAAVA